MWRRCSRNFSFFLGGLGFFISFSLAPMVPPTEARTMQVTNLEGACLETLTDWQGEFQEDIGRGITLAFRWNGTRQVYLLARDTVLDQGCPATKGHTIISTLFLPPIRNDQLFGVEYDCFNLNGRVKKGDPLIGIFNRGSRTIPSKAERAWLVDLATNSFESVRDAACNSFS